MVNIYHILIVEDDKGLREGIALALGSADYSFTYSTTIAEAGEQFNNQKLDLVLLDINLPDGSGYDFLKKVKEQSSLPVIILTANDMEIDEVTGLQLGAADYITKPFSLTVLRLRIEKVLQNTYGGGEKEYRFGQLSFCFETMEFYKAGQILSLSRTEQKLLRLLVENVGMTLAREVLIDRIWSDGAEYVDANALSVAVNRLRTKLEDDPAHPAYLQTVYGQGYMWKKM